MTQPPVRRLPDLTGPGPLQMAADEALLEAAVEPTIRLYSWTPATVSLGYFQDYATVCADLAATGHPLPALVRRITGGGAIWHEHELTYALVAVVGRDLPVQPAAMYARIHGAIRAALTARGAVLDRQEATTGDRRYRDEPRCFASPAAEDLILAQGKVLGSAARVRGDRVLIHGSLKLASNPWDGDVVAGCGLSVALAAEALVSGLATALGGDGGANVAAGEWTAAELSARQRIEKTRYHDDTWVRLRQGPRP